MTDMIPPADDRETARQIAAAHTAASRDVEAFLRQVPELPSPEDVAEYAALLAREEALRTERTDAAEAAGLGVPTIGGA
ncbi:hypothetical protein [Plantactinospora endophytica]|uniref:Uncharacterized protein n=1 Tax=Plantactinospora endophytica TaxID=673535 RepID=A0ABQ4DYG3_9ACTN|nr:hypothetical protein [Plantactinospora endophytica]GIG87476.1 hypothetical protein Pen02_24120 [Plantactinospora endophytica]